jgi:hypothetical protein
MNPRPALKKLALLTIGLCFCLLSRAALLDEVQVYTDDINKPGEWGLELHINTTPKGVTAPTYAGEIVNHHGIRVTPEISYGISPTLEAGLYLPTVRTANGTTYLAGFKTRLKWLPIQPEQFNGWFAGTNLELARNSPPFSESRLGLEVRNIVGWKNHDWLLAVNPIFGWNLSEGYRNKSPDFTLATKVSRQVHEGIALGLEYYNGRGQLNNRLPTVQQDNTLYFVVDYEGKPFNFSFGIGKGRTPASDTWTAKSIIDWPF